MLQGPLTGVGGGGNACSKSDSFLPYLPGMGLNWSKRARYQVTTDILILTNGPGELSTWVHPVVRQLFRGASPLRITVALVPCPYASGEEAASVALWPEAVRIWNPAQTIRYLLTGRPPAPLSGRGLVLFLGGDPFYGVLASNRTHFPLFAYTETDGRWVRFTERFLVSDRQRYLAHLARGIPAAKLALVGNLMADAVKPALSPDEAREALGIAEDELVVGLLPGSKPFKVRFIAPLLLKVAEEIQARIPNVRFLIYRSPFTPLSQLAEAVSDTRLAAVTGGTTGTLLATADGEATIHTDGGLTIQVVGPGGEPPYAAMSVADLALTVPGTNTAELATLGVPMMVLLPLNRPEEIPVDGAIHWLGKLPVVGAPLKAAIIRSLARRLSYVALPNQRAGQLVTPERVGLLDPAALGEEAAELLADPVRRREIRLALLGAMGPSGAAESVVEQVECRLFGRERANASP